MGSKSTTAIERALSTQQIIELENLRKEFNIPQENFLMFVSMSIQFGRRIVKRDYDMQRKLWPNKSGKSVLRNLLIDDLSKDPELTGNTQKDLEQVVVLADEAMKKIDTLGELCDYLGPLEYQSNTEYYKSTLAQRIDDVIGGKKTIQCPKCSQKLTIPYYYVSMEGTCPGCGELISLPYGFQPRMASHDRQEVDRNSKSNEEKLTVDELAYALHSYAVQVMKDLDTYLNDYCSGNKYESTKELCRLELYYFCNTVMCTTIAKADGPKLFYQKVTNIYRKLCIGFLESSDLRNLDFSMSQFISRINAYATTWAANKTPAWLLSVILFHTKEKDYVQSFTAEQISVDDLLNRFMQNPDTLKHYFDNPTNIVLGNFFVESSTKTSSFLGALKSKYTIIE